MGTPERGAAETKVLPIEPDRISIQGSQPTHRTFHRDPRGFLVEALRSDDVAVQGAHFRMSYSSLTLPGHFRDADRWHVHRIQSDRFVVILGEMMLALYDGRPESKTNGTLEVVRMTGEPFTARGASSPSDARSYLVPIPPGVLHCIGNLSDQPFLLQNFPTELYNPADEGRVPFSTVRIEKLGGSFDWSRVAVSHRPEEGSRATS